MRLLIVTGLSGAGKSRAVNALEDFGWFCVDNLPPRLTLIFAKLLSEGDQNRSRVAVVMDSRAGGAFLDVFWALDSLQSEGYAFELLFLDASDAVLARRYKETRRQHPLGAQNPTLGLQEAIASERRLLAPLRARADLYVDTSALGSAELRDRIAELFAQGREAQMRVHINSFGFKHGAPGDSDLLFDVRCLPNPFYVPELKEKTGLGTEIESYVFSFPEAGALFAKILDMLLFLLPLYQKEGKSSLVISVGCTGGKHRSVLFARRLGEELQGAGYAAHITHLHLKAPQ
ncbi:MAG: RNase adapter RapZ [Oscillospiraceae bacterium]|jgi:UPF0042 nucleotide-binding protein|nr:RNase adapter RapZ [Oscillospiraceae bacterium]